MMENWSLTIVWLGFFASILLGWYFYLQARNKERMALIEKNADVSEIFKERVVRFPWLKLGMLIAGVGFGLCLVVFLLPVIDTPNLQGGKQALIVGSILLFGGVGIIIAHFIEKPKVH